MPKNFAGFERNKAVQTQAPKVPSRLNSKRSSPRHGHQIVKEEKKIPKTRKKHQVTHKGKPVKLCDSRLANGNLPGQRQRDDTFKALKENKQNSLQPRILYPVKLSFRSKE